MDKQIQKEDNSHPDKDLIGVDPLAWMSDEEKQNIQEGNDSSVNNLGEAPMELMSVLTIRDAETLIESLKDIDRTAGPIVIDASQVEKIDTPAMQVIASFCQTVKQDGTAVQWKAPSEKLLEATTLLGLNDLFAYESLAQA